MSPVTELLLHISCPRCESGRLTVEYVPASPASSLYVDDVTSSCTCWTPTEIDELMGLEDGPASPFIEGLEAVVRQWEQLKALVPPVAESEGASGLESKTPAAAWKHRRGRLRSTR